MSSKWSNSGHHSFILKITKLWETFLYALYEAGPLPNYNKKKNMLRKWFIQQKWLLQKIMASSENDGSCNVISGGDRSYGQT